MSVQYSVDVHPRTAVLGTQVTAVLRCTAKGDTSGVLTFQHKSLVLELNSEHLSEPSLAFPNRFAVEDQGMLIRMSLDGGLEDLQNGEERTRTFDLLALFPDDVLDVGKILFTYRLEDGDPLVRPEPAALKLESGPEAVPLLIECLDSPSSGIRSRAAELLRRVTAQDFSKSAEWSEWWTKEGVRLPWNYDTEGAVWNAKPSAPSSPVRRSIHLGGVEYAGNPAKADE